MYVDSHAHLTGDELFAEADQMVDRALIAHVGTILNICTDKASLERGLELSKRYPHVFNAGAVTPHDVDLIGETDWPFFEEAAKKGLLNAVGETGLDYYNANAAPELQKEHLKRYLRLARECNLPVVIHCREAFEDFFSIYDEEAKGLPGQLHCFTGTMEEAKGVIERGLFLSFSGILTFKNSHALREVAFFAPLEKIVVETDTPYLAPQSKRGKRNEPAYVTEVVEMLAQLKGLPVDRVAEITTTNAKKLFNI